MNDLIVEYRKRVPVDAEPHKDDFESIKMKNKIIEDYMYLADVVVRSRKKKLPKHVDADDLYSLAMIGLMQAVRRFKSDLGVPFEAFVTQRMRSVIGDGIRNDDWAPRSLRKAQRDIMQAEDAIRKDGHEPTEEDVAALLQITVEDISLIKHRSEIASHTYIEGSMEAQNKSADGNDEDDEVVNLLKSVLARSVQNLPIRQAVVIVLHYYSEMKIAEIAKLLRTTEQKVGAWHTSAVLNIWNEFTKSLEAIKLDAGI